jgi:hypothetical protein
MKFKRAIGTGAATAMLAAGLTGLSAGVANANTIVASGGGCRAPYPDADQEILRPCIQMEDSAGDISAPQSFMQGGGNVYGWYLTLYKQSSNGSWNAVSGDTRGPYSVDLVTTPYYNADGYGKFYVAMSWLDTNGVWHDMIESPVLTITNCPCD